ncbi:MAG: threonine synthase [Acidobacteriaceae bacterium]|nr:threonine synthase [Acidobacteriaceae bacterium]
MLLSQHEAVDLYNKVRMRAYLVCFEPTCRTKYDLADVLYQCPRCGGLLEVEYEWQEANTSSWKETWRERRLSNGALDQSGVWRYRELLPFDGQHSVTTLREGNTPMLEGPLAAQYAGIDRITFKHQGFNPTGSFKDNGMSCGVSQAVRLGKHLVGCVSTGNTAASMAAYASAAGLKPVIFLPEGNISFGKLAQALEYGAITLQVKTNFDEILALVRNITEAAGMYLLNSINPFRIEGQKTMAVEMADQLEWDVPDWVVMPGGNLGNASAFGKGFLELFRLRLIDRLPRLAIIQACGSAPLYAHLQTARGTVLTAVRNPETLATAIRIGNPVSWPKALSAVEQTGGVVESVTEQEIADSKAIIGKCGIGCEPASAATLAGVKKLVARGVIRRADRIVAVLTGNLLKDPEYIYRYHTADLRTPDGAAITSTFGNKPRTVENDPDELLQYLSAI